MSRVKLCMLGDGGVGKTAFTIQFCSNIFVEQYDPTIEDSYRKHVTVDKRDCVIDILDTAGQEEFAALRDQWIVGCQGFCLVYSITSKSSFDDIEEFVEQVEQAKDADAQDLCWVLVGNKADLAAVKREVTIQEGSAKAKSISKTCAFFESSAKTRTNVDEALFELVRMLRDKAGDGDDAEAGTADGKSAGKPKKKAGGMCNLL